MKKIILLMFILVFIGLQFPYYTLSLGAESVTVNINIQSLIMALSSGGADNTGTILVYGIPFIGMIISVVSLIIKRNMSVITCIIGVIGMLYNGFVYFFVTGNGGSVNFGFVITLISYFVVIISSVLVIRVDKSTK